MSIIKFSNKHSIKKSKLIPFAKKINLINQKILNESIEGHEWLGWKDIESYANEEVLNQINKCANRIIKKVSILVVIGIGGSYLGAKAGIEYVKGVGHHDSNLKIIWMGHTLSSTYLCQQMNYLQDKDFAIVVISKSGTTIEPAVSFNLLKKILIKKHPENYNEYIVAVTDEKNGVLKKIASLENFETFVIPSNVGGRYSVLTPVGLLVFACYGIDIYTMIKGAKTAFQELNEANYKKNSAIEYAITRFILSKTHSTEIFCNYEPHLVSFNEWLKQLFAESEGKKDKGIWPSSVSFTTDLHSLGQFIQEGKTTFFQTTLWIETPKLDYVLKTLKDNDELGFLENKSIHEINEVAFKATLKAHASDRKIPNNIISIDETNEYSFGYLSMWFFIACTYYCYLLKVNPFNQPGVEVYKAHMKKSW